MYTLNNKNREQNVCKINMCLRVKNCCHKNGQNFPVHIIFPLHGTTKGIYIYNNLVAIFDAYIGFETCMFCNRWCKVNDERIGW